MINDDMDTHVLLYTINQFYKHDRNPESHMLSLD